MPKKILVISPTPFYPQDAGSHSRIYHLILNLNNLGHDVHFLYIQHETPDDKMMRQIWGSKFYSLPYIEPGTRKRSLAERIFRKIRCFLFNYPIYPHAIDDWYDNSINKFLIKLQSQIKFDAVIIEYVFFSKALNYFGDDVIKIIDTHDIFTNRHEIYHKNNQEYTWYSTTAKQEAMGLNRANVVIAIQKNENQYFKNLVNKKVVTVGHIVNIRKSKSINNTNKLLCIASASPENIEGIQYFTKNILPIIRNNISNIQLLIAGRVCEKIDDTEGCIKLGFVDNLEDLYDSVSVVINPVRFGTGLKIKSIEALGQSKVLITTPEGANGLEEGIGKAFLVANNVDDFARNIIEVLTNQELFSSLCENAYAFAEKYNKEIFEPLVEILSEA